MEPIKLFQGHDHQSFHLKGGESVALFIHGFPGTPAELRPLAERLHSEGWSVDGILLPGFGQHFDQLKEKKFADWITAVENRLDLLEDRFGTRMVCGFSMGAALALIASARRPVDGVVLLAPFWKVSGWLWRLVPFLQVTFPEFKPFRLANADLNKYGVRQALSKFLPGVDLDDPIVRQQIRSYSFQTRIINEIRNVGMLATSLAPSIRSPILVIQGSHDPIVKPAMTKELLGKLNCPITYLEVEGEHDLLDPKKPAWNKIQSSVINFAATINSG